jgi:membrane protease YdiL (CAAX protease family)
MIEPAPALVPPESNWLDRLQALVEVVLISGLVSSFFAALPFSVHLTSGSLPTNARIVTGFILVEAAITLLLLALILRAHREGLHDLGLDGRRWLGHVAVGMAVLPLLFLTNIVVGELFRRFFPGYFIDRNPLIELVRTPADLGLFLLSGIVAGGIKEELQRAFIITRFRRHLGGAWLGLVLWSLAFAAGHYLQGLQGVVIAGVLGLIFGVIYLARGSVIAPIVAHAVYDTVVLIGYWLFVRTDGARFTVR